MTHSPARPEARYGRPRRGPGRRTLLFGTAAVVVAGVALAFLGYQRLASHEVSGELASYRLIDSQTVEVTVSVTRKDPSIPVVCILRARSKDGTETGRRELLVGPSDQETVQVSADVRTSHPPVTGDVYGCGTELPRYLVTPGSK